MDVQKEENFRMNYCQRKGKNSLISRATRQIFRLTPPIVAIEFELILIYANAIIIQQSRSSKRRAIVSNPQHNSQFRMVSKNFGLNYSVIKFKNIKFEQIYQFSKSHHSTICRRYGSQLGFHFSTGILIFENLIFEVSFRRFFASFTSKVTNMDS